MATGTATPPGDSTYRGPARWPLSVEAYHGLGDLGLIPKKAEILHGFVYHKTKHDYDRDKLSAYAAAGVKEAWLVLGPERMVEVYRRPEGGRYAESLVFPADALLASTVLPGVSVPFSELFRT